MKILTTIYSAISNPVQIPSRIKLRLKRSKVKNLYQKTQKQNLDLFLKYQAVLEKYHIGGGYSRNMQDLKLFDLNRILNEQKPTKTLEIGSGCTSYVFCEYALKNNTTHHTWDESEKWLSNTKNICPAGSLNSRNIKFLTGTKIIFEDKDPVEIRLSENLSDEYDLVFIDGPTLKIAGVQNSRYINTDIFEIVKFHKPRCIVVDIRKATVEEIQKRIGQHYFCEMSHLLDLKYRTVKNRINYFTVFRLNESLYI